MSQTNPIPDDNVERLIGQAARPEPIDPAFVERVHARLEEEASQRRRPAGHWNRRRAVGVLVGLAAAAAIFLLVNRLMRPPGEEQRPVSRPFPADTEQRPFTTMAKGQAPEPDRAAVGADIRTGAGEYKRVRLDRKSTRLNSSHLGISYAVFCLKK